MAEEVVIISNAAAEMTEGAADEVVRHSDAMRISLGVMFILGGLVGGAACIVIPVVHLFTTWGLPLLGVMLAIRTFKRRVVIDDVTGECPTCHERIELRGGSMHDSTWQKCPECGGALRVRPAEAGRPAGGAEKATP